MALANGRRMAVIDSLEAVQEAIEGAQEQLLSLQRTTGEWCGELEGDSILESETVLLLHSLGKSDSDLARKLGNYLKQIQTPEGGWANYYGGPCEVSATVKAYFALKLLGEDPNSPPMRRARETALRLGGVPACNSFTKIYLALFGQYDWEDVPAIPPELMLLPPSFYFNINAMSSWSRTILVPLAILWAYRPRFEVREEAGIGELFPGGREQGGTGLQAHAPFPSWRHFFLGVDRAAKLLDRAPLRPLREKALQAAEKWILDRCRKTAGLGAIFPPIVNSIWALRCRGYAEESPEVQSQYKELLDLVIEEEDTARVQPCTSPVWDTALACIALEESGLSREHPSFAAALDWLAAHEVKEAGDWKAARPNLEPGGWYFEYANEFYPDIDDTAMVLIALARMDGVPLGLKERALNWVLGMQSRNGGWASFDADNDRSLLCEVPFADHNAMIDPPTADITGRMLEMLSVYEYNEHNGRVSQALEFLRREQESDGSWFGRWGVNYIYGTWQVLKGMAAIGVSPRDPCIRRGAQWLISRQNPDGGWGESCDSYDRPVQRGCGASTPSQTAWAVMGLIAAGEAASPAVKHGVDYLLREQSADGSWPEEFFTGTGFPKVFYLKYHLYRLYFPLFALGMYRKAIQTDHSAALLRTGSAGILSMDRS